MGAISMVLAEALLSLVSVVVGALIGFLSAWRMWKIQTRHQRRIMARAFLLEVQRLKPMLQGWSNIYVQTKSGQGPFSHPEAVRIESPICVRDNLYYFAVQKEIWFFPTGLAESLYTFYMRLIEAEQARQFTLADDKFRPFYAETVWKCIFDANESIPHLEKLLAKEAAPKPRVRRTQGQMRGIAERIAALKIERGDEK